MEKTIKSLGQNFLTNKKIVKDMVEALSIKKGDVVVEIGPGPGIFTTEIVKNISKFNTFYAIELDSRFVDKLKEDFSRFTNVHIVNEDFLSWANTNTFENCVVLGSIPYYITSPIIHSLIKMEIPPKVIVLMMQKEVAEKITEKKVKPNYFSTFVKTFYDIKYLSTVDKRWFKPTPKVDSAIVKFEKKDNVGITNVANYENFLHLGFRHPKKMLNKVFDKELLKRGHLSGKERPHNIELSNWVKIYKGIYEI